MSRGESCGRLGSLEVKEEAGPPHLASESLGALVKKGLLTVTNVVTGQIFGDSSHSLSHCLQEFLRKDDL